MQFARFWIPHTAVQRGPEGEKQATAWGWSNISESDALQLARKRAQGFVDRVGEAPSTGYLLYANRPLREPILEELVPGSVVVSRNSAGCDILNTSEVAFVDVDIDASSSTGGFLAGLFGGTRRSPRDVAIEESLELVRSWVNSNPQHGFRLYETAGGLRYLLTSQTLSPDSAGPMFQALGADPAYRQLCELQKSFRARLTPKPWRCDMEKPPCRFPYSTPETAQAIARWDKDYALRATRFSTCRFLAHAGPEAIHPAVASVVSMHDKRTRALESLPLA